MAAASTSWWQPTTGTTFFIDLSQQLNTTYASNITAIDGDLFNNPNTTWTALQNSGHKTICYFSAGSFEDWRPDVAEFNRSSDLGKPLDGWPGEWWLDTNSDNVRRLMTQRMDLASQKGCDAVDPDNIDGYDNDNGLGLTQDDAVNYVQFLASEAHTRGMAIGLKNALEIIPAVQPYVDFAVNEQCLQYQECDQSYPFVQNSTMHKPVFELEYEGNIQDICDDTTRQTFTTLLKHMNLDAWYEACATNQLALNALTTNGSLGVDSPTASSSSSDDESSGTIRTTAGSMKIAAILAIIGVSVFL